MTREQPDNLNLHKKTLQYVYLLMSLALIKVN